MWPHEAVTLEAVHSFRDSAQDYFDYLVRDDGVVLGSGAGAIFAYRARRVVTLITVLAGQRRRGAGTALYEFISRWASERGARELEVSVSSNDPESRVGRCRSPPRGWVSWTVEMWWWSGAGSKRRPSAFQAGGGFLAPRPPRAYRLTTASEHMSPPLNPRVGRRPSPRRGSISPPREPSWVPRSFAHYSPVLTHLPRVRNLCAAKASWKSFGPSS